MNVIVMRHGIAERESLRDFDRKLTEQGAQVVAQMALRYAQQLNHVSAIWASPLVRAQETARIVQSVLSVQGVELPLHTTPLIVPEGRVAEVYDFLNNLHSDQILLVSHMPFVGNFLDDFTGAPPGTHDMGTASIASLSYDYAAAQLAQLEWVKHAYE